MRYIAKDFVSMFRKVNDVINRLGVRIVLRNVYVCS